MIIANRVARICGGIAAAVSANALAKLALGPHHAIDLLGLSGMQPMTAVCLMLSALALVLLTWRKASIRLVARICSIVVFIVAGMTLLAYGFDSELFLDDLPFRASVPVSASHPNPGRIAFGTALSLLPLALSLAACSSRTGSKLQKWAPLLATLSLVPASLAAVGYLIGVDVLNGSGFVTAMALPTATSLLLLASGALALSSDRGWVARFRGAGPGARMTRTLLPLVIIGPLSAAWLLDIGVRAGAYGADFRLVLVSVSMAFLLAVAVVQHARWLDQADVTLRSSERRLSLFIEGAPAAIAMFDREMRYMAVSRRYLTDYGLPGDLKVIGISHYDVFPDIPQKWRNIHAQALAGQPMEADEDPFPRADGHTDWVRWKFEPWRDEAGNVGGVLLFSEVITAQRQAREELRESEERLHRVLQEAPFPVMVHAEDGEVVLVSRALLDLTGYAASEISSISDWCGRAYGPQEVQVKQKIDRLYELDQPADEGDFEVQACDGRKLLWAIRSAPVGRDAKGRRLVVSMAADLTQRRETETRLLLLMGEVDHRAKNALAVVQAITQLSRADSAAAYAEAVQGRVAAMSRAHGHLSDSGWSNVNLRLLVEGETSAVGTKVHLDENNSPVSIRPEAAQAVTLVLHELATNASKHGALSRAGGWLRVMWQASQLDGSLQIDWDEFDASPVVTLPGRPGFGMSMMRQTIENQLRGKIEFHWKGQGFCCRITLPAGNWHLDHSLAVVPNHEVVPPPLVATKGRRVLVVEDEALTALALQKLLQDAGFDVLGPVARVNDALDLIRTGNPGAAVLDVNLFGETVKPVADSLRDMGVPFLFCTGYQKGGAVAEYHRQAPVVNKPVNANLLIKAVGNLFDT